MPNAKAQAHYRESLPTEHCTTREGPRVTESAKQSHPLPHRPHNPKPNWIAALAGVDLAAAGLAGLVCGAGPGVAADDELTGRDTVGS